MKSARTVVRTKQDLLPLPASDRDRIALECYLALCTLESGHGSRHTLSVLANALVTVYFLIEAGIGAEPAVRSTFTAAQDAINRCDSEAIAVGRCGAGDGESARAIGALLKAYDRQLRLAPRAVVETVAGQVDAYWRNARGAADRSAALTG